MPGKRPWVSRIPQIRKAVEENEAQDRYSRRDVEMLFGVGRSAAAELMSTIGRSGECSSRSAILDFLRYGKEAQEAEIEANRRANLARKLKQAEQDLRFRNRAIHPTPGAEWATFEDLPHVAVEPGRIVIIADGAQDALQTLWSLSKAIGNEWEKFESMIEVKEEKAS